METNTGERGWDDGHTWKVKVTPSGCRTGADRILMSAPCCVAASPIPREGQMTPRIRDISGKRYSRATASAYILHAVPSGTGVMNTVLISR